jgi:DNA repair exonuclease SbcCD ATPase subunit
VTFLEALEIEAFRGFASRQVIRLDSDAVVVTGPNGLGKTSLTDAVTWVLTGTLPQMRARQGRRDEEYVVNRYREGEEAEVTLHVGIDGQRWALRRRGSSKRGSELSVESGRDRCIGDAAGQALCGLFGARDQREIDLAVQGWGILRQDEMRAVLSAPAEEFQARLRDILGLAVLAEFEKAAKDASKEAMEAAAAARSEAEQLQVALSSAEADLNAHRARLLEATSAEATAGAVANRLGQHADLVRVDPGALSQPGGPQEALRACSALAHELRTHAITLRQLASDAATAAPVDEEALETSAQRLASLERRAAAASEALQLAERNYAALRARADDMARLAAAALPLLSTHCPVCAQEIDPHDVGERLRHQLDAGHEATDLREASEAVGRYRSVLADARASVHAERQTVDMLRARLARQAQAAAQHDDIRRVITSLVQDPMVSLPALQKAPDTPDVVERTAEALDAVGRLLRPLIRAAQDRAIETRVPRLAQRVDEAQQRHALAVRRLESLARRGNEARQLSDAATAASLDVTEEALAALDPYFGEVFRRLAAHPTFSELGLHHDVYYGKARTWARLTDPVTGVEANPQLVLSEGQLNVVALSYFIAFALAAGDKALPFVILDDPLQSLDDMNVLGFSDFCRHLRDSRQVMVTTHDRRFGNLLERKLKPRRPNQSSARLHFESWDREGPKLTYERFTLDYEPALLASKDGDQPPSAGSA